MIRLRQRPRIAPLPALAAAVVAALAFAAGQWQTGRAAQKDVIESRQAATRDAAEIVLSSVPVDGAGVDGRRVMVRGTFQPGATVFWDNRFAGRIAGMAVVTPLIIEGGRRAVLVDRGLVVPGADRTRLPAIATPDGTVEIRGRAYLAPERTLELADNVDAGALWQNLTPAKFARRTGLEVQPFLLRQDGGPGGEGLNRAPDSPPSADTGMTAAKHRGYAFQWYSLATLTVVLFVLFTFFQHDKPSRDA
jgi:cytochrome oxidase assembly protein ShyY1